MIGIIIGNVCSILAMISESFSSTRKTNRSMLMVQIVSQVFYGIGSAALKGYSAVVQNVVAIFRNVVAMKGKTNRILEWIMIASGVLFGIAFNNRGIIGLLPVLANLEYSVAVFYCRTERSLKAAFLVNSVMFIVFNFFLQNYVGFVTNTVVAVTTLIFLIKSFRKKQPETAETAVNGETEATGETEGEQQK